MFKVKYSNQGKIECSPIRKTIEDARKTAAFLRYQGAKRVKIINMDYEPPCYSEYTSRERGKMRTMNTYQYQKCSYYGNESERTRCHKPADGLLYAPDGKRVPGGYFCQEHGKIITDEYREKIGEIWILRKD